MEKKITKADVKQVDIQKLIDTLYQNAVKELELNEDERNLLEERLITTEGYRLPVYLNIARSNPNVRMEKIKGLEEKKIIKRYFVDGKPCIEIIHDKYAAAAKRERDFKILINQKKLRLLKEQEELKLKISEEKSCTGKSYL